MEFDYIQEQAMNRMKSGSILVGGTGSGKSRTALAYFFVKECGGRIDIHDGKGDVYLLKDIHKPLYIITTAAKRDKGEWQKEMIPFGLTAHIDSWNNIKKYIDVDKAFFIFDEQRVVGSGTWSKSFIKISKKNNWIMLSATPGDQWCDYIPVFIANGFYKNRTEFYTRHVVFSRYTDYPKIEKYIDTDRLEKLKKSILIEMNVKRGTVPHKIFDMVQYNVKDYEEVSEFKWDIFKNKPIENASQYMSIIRKIVNSDESRIHKVLEYVNKHKKVIIFYNFDYERELIIQLCDDNKITYSEWNGHNHQPIPNTNTWCYLVQYNAGSEGWECTDTDTIIFYSLSYSYRMMKQASGRIDRRNTKFVDLYYYYILSESKIDKEILKALRNKKDFNERDFLKKAKTGQNLDF